MRNLKTSWDFSRKRGIGMNTYELKHMARVAEWKEKVAACRSSGQTVRGWYEEQGINRKRYYYWERTVLAEAEKQL